MSMPLPLVALGSIIAVEIATNLGCVGWLATPASERHHVGLLVALDVGCSRVLYFTVGRPIPSASCT